MIVLPSNWRFTVFNNCGQTIGAADITVTGFRWRFVNGALEYDSEVQTFLSNSSLATASYENGSPYDNTGESAKWVGLDALYKVTSPASANGLVRLYLDASDGTNWPDNGDSLVVASFSMGASQTRRRWLRLG